MIGEWGINMSTVELVNQNNRMFGLLAEAIEFVNQKGPLAEKLDTRTSAGILWTLGICNFQQKHKGYLSRSFERLFQSPQCNMSVDECNFDFESWDTSLVLLALIASGIKKYLPIGRKIARWLEQEYDESSVRDEPWETLWVTLALLVSGNFEDRDINDHIGTFDWLLSKRNSDGILVSPHYCGLLILTLSCFINKYALDAKERDVYVEVAKRHFDYLIAEYKRTKQRGTLWRDEPWHIGLILLGLANCGPNSIDLFQDIDINLDIEQKLKDLWTPDEGWVDIVDTAALMFGLATYLVRRSEVLQKSGTTKKIDRENFVKEVNLYKKSPADLPNVFISYSTKDLFIAKRLRKSLEERAIDVWLAEDDLIVGELWESEIYTKIQNSDYLLLIVTHNSLESKWVRKELNKARMREIEDEETVILPLLFEECKLPPRLSRLQYADFRNYEDGYFRLLKRLIPDNIYNPDFPINFDRCRLPASFRQCLYCGSDQIEGAVISANASRKYPNVLCRNCGNWY